MSSNNTSSHLSNVFSHHVDLVVEDGTDTSRHDGWLLKKADENPQRPVGSNNVENVAERQRLKRKVKKKEQPQNERKD